MSFKLYPKEVFMSLLFFIFALLFLNVMAVASKFYFGHNYVYGLVPLFDFNKEGNIPTLYSSLALMFASGLLLIIARAHKKNGAEHLSWLGLSVIFLFLSIDEIASIHEQFGSLIREALNTSGLLYYAWVIPYGAVLLVLAILYFTFLIRLPKNIMILFVISGVTFVSGAIGFELLGGRQHELYGANNITYAIYYTLEEFLEMLGVVIFIYALLTYFVNQFKLLTITVNEPK